MDFLSNLPVEISLKILGYLGPEQLTSCSSVCSRWSCLANCECLWKKFSPKDEECVHPKVNGSDCCCRYKVWFARKYLSVKKWIGCNYWIHYGQINACHALMGNGAIFIEAQGKTISVYDFNDGESNLVNTIDTTIPGILFDKSCSTWFSENILVLQTKWSSLLWCYKWQGKGLEFIDGVYGIYGDSADIFLASFKDSGLPQSKDASVVRWNRVLVEGDYLVMPHSKSKIYIWSLPERKCIVALSNLPTGFCSVFTNNGLIYICSYLEILVFTIHGIQKAVVKYDNSRFVINDCFLYFNKSTILAAFSGASVMHAAWDLDLQVLSRPFDLDTIGMLHPSLPAVCFIQTVETELLAKKFVAIDIRSKCILWETESFHCSRIFTKFVPNCNYVILTDKYMVYFCSRETNEPGAFRSWFLVDLEEGKLKTSCTLPFRSHLYRPKYCGKKVIIYDTSYKANMCFIFT